MTVLRQRVVRVDHEILAKRLSADDLRDIASRLNGPDKDDDD